MLNPKVHSRGGRGGRVFHEHPGQGQKHKKLLLCPFPLSLRINLKNIYKKLLNFTVLYEHIHNGCKNIKNFGLVFRLLENTFVSQKIKSLLTPPGKFLPGFYFIITHQAEENSHSSKAAFLQKSTSSRKGEETIDYDTSITYDLYKFSLYMCKQFV